MNIETKSVRGNYDEYLKFGWEHTQDSPARSGRSHYTAHILARDKDVENHRLIETLEKKYFYLKSQIKTYSPITDSPENFLLILLFIFPFVIYCVYKGNQKRKIQENNERLEEQMEQVLIEVKPLI